MICVCISIICFFNKSCYYDKVKDLYSNGLVNALEKGHTYLEEKPSQKLLELENPYDFALRQERGVKRNLDYIWDAALYNGKYYVYFGILPAIAIMIPYHLVTGMYLSSSIVTLIFSILTIITMAILIKNIFKKYFPNLDFKYMFFSSVIMIISTMLIWLNLAPRFYELVTVAGLFFAILGVLFIIISEKDGKISYWKITSGTLSLALAVACRPTQLLTSILIIPAIWKILKNNIKEKKNITKLIISVAIPYLIIGLPLMYYNYIRFGSILDFGTGYQLTLNDMGHLSTQISRIPTGIVCDLFNIPVFKATFPFIVKNSNIIDTFTYYYVEDIPGGVFMLSPIAFFCFGIIKFWKNSENKELRKFVLGLIIIGILLVMACSVKAGSTGRYLADFAWMFVLAGIIIFMNYLQNMKTDEGKKVLNKVFYFIVCFTILINILLGFCDIGGNISIKNFSPKTFYNIEYSIMFMK